MVALLSATVLPSRPPEAMIAGAAMTLIAAAALSMLKPWASVALALTL